MNEPEIRKAGHGVPGTVLHGVKYTIYYLDVTHLQILIILKFFHKITHKTSEFIRND